MEGFSYTDIFETKGIEYLIIIGFLFLIIPFWYFLTRPKTSEALIRKSERVLSASSLKIPMGIFFSRNHTWAYLETSGMAKTGLDDFLKRVAGPVKVNFLRAEGDEVRKGQPVAELMHDGKVLKVLSPLSGTIGQVNHMLNETLSESDPIESSWIYRIKPSDWKVETSHFFLAGEAADWFKREIERYKDLIAEFRTGYTPANPYPVMQDGGELKDVGLNDLPDQAWHTFEKSFLTSELET